MEVDARRIRCSRNGQPGDDPRVRSALEHALDSLAQIPLAREEFLSSLLALNDDGGTLRILWSSSVSLKKFAGVVDRAWEHVAAGSTSEHQVSPPQGGI